MYAIYIGRQPTTLLHRTDIDDMTLRVMGAKLDLEVNTSGKLDFTMPPNHKYIDDVLPMETIIWVFQDSEVIFHGRVVSADVDTFLQKKVTCESDIGFLIDSQQKPFKYSKNKKTPKEVFIQCIHNHNEFVGSNSFKYFHVNQNSVYQPDTTQKIEKDESSYRDTKAALDSLLIDTYGGYVRTRTYKATSGSNSGQYITYIDYIKDYKADQNGKTIQTLSISRNIIDLSQESSTDDMYTVLIPVGGSRGSNDGPIEGTPIIDEDKKQKYGKIARVQQWSDIKELGALNEKAQKYWNANKKRRGILKTFNVKAFDLSLTTVGIEKLRLGWWYTINFPKAGLDSISRMCSKISYDLDKPENTEITLDDGYQEKNEENAKSNSRGGGRTGAGSTASQQIDHTKSVQNYYADLFTIKAENLTIEADKATTRFGELNSTIVHNFKLMFGDNAEDTTGLIHPENPETTVLEMFRDQNGINAAISNMAITAVDSKFDLTDALVKLGKFTFGAGSGDELHTDYLVVDKLLKVPNGGNTVFNNPPKIGDERTEGGWSYAATQKYVDDAVAGIDLSSYMLKAGGTFSGDVNFSGVTRFNGDNTAVFHNAPQITNPPSSDSADYNSLVAHRGYVKSYVANQLNNYVLASGGDFTGKVDFTSQQSSVFNAVPSIPDGAGGYSPAASRAWVIDRVEGGSNHGYFSILYAGSGASKYNFYNHYHSFTMSQNQSTGVVTAELGAPQETQPASSTFDVAASDWFKQKIEEAQQGQITNLSVDKLVPTSASDAATLSGNTITQTWNIQPQHDNGAGQNPRYVDLNYSQQAEISINATDILNSVRSTARTAGYNSGVSDSSVDDITAQIATQPTSTVTIGGNRWVNPSLTLKALHDLGNDNWRTLATESKNALVNIESILSSAESTAASAAETAILTSMQPVQLGHTVGNPVEGKIAVNVTGVAIRDDNGQTVTIDGTSNMDSFTIDVPSGGSTKVQTLITPSYSDFSTNAWKAAVGTSDPPLAVTSSGWISLGYAYKLDNDTNWQYYERKGVKFDDWAPLFKDAATWDITFVSDASNIRTGSKYRPFNVKFGFGNNSQTKTINVSVEVSLSTVEDRGQTIRVAKVKLGGTTVHVQTV